MQKYNNFISKTYKLKKNYINSLRKIKNTKCQYSLFLQNKLKVFQYQSDNKKQVKQAKRDKSVTESQFKKHQKQTFFTFFAVITEIFP